MSGSQLSLPEFSFDLCDARVSYVLQVGYYPTAEAAARAYDRFAPPIAPMTHTHWESPAAPDTLHAPLLGRPCFSSFHRSTPSDGHNAPTS